MRQKHLIFQCLPLLTEPTWISMEVYILFNVCFSHKGTTYLFLQSSLKALLENPMLCCTQIQEQPWDPY